MGRWRIRSTQLTPGPGLGSTIGPVGNFVSLQDVAKWLLCVLMIMGRLEILTVAVLFSPVFWRH